MYSLPKTSLLLSCVNLANKNLRIYYILCTLTQKCLRAPSCEKIISEKVPIIFYHCLLSDERVCGIPLFANPYNHLCKG